MGATTICYGKARTHAAKTLFDLTDFNKTDELLHKTHL